MTKRQLIDEIVVINQSAKPAFLAEFADDDLQDYLDHLKVIRRPRLSGNSHRYDAYFQAAPASPHKADQPGADSDQSASAETFAEALSRPIRSASRRQEHRDATSRHIRQRGHTSDDVESWLF